MRGRRGSFARAALFPDEKNMGCRRPACKNILHPPRVTKPKPPGPSSGSPKQRKGRCPRCGLEFLFTSVTQHTFFPFCSQRCRDVDLGNWLTGKYVIPGKEEPNPGEAFQEPEPESDDDGT